MTSPLAIFTVACNHDLAAARGLLASARMHHPDADMFVCLADRKLDEPDLYDPAWSIIEADRLTVRDFAELSFRFESEELKSALKPLMFQYLLKNFGYGFVIYVDPGLRMQRPLDGVLQPLGARASFVFEPQQASGARTLGLLAVRRGAVSASLLTSWARSARFGCDTQREGVTDDQGFFDAVAEAPHEGRSLGDAALGDAPFLTAPVFQSDVPAGLYAYGRFASGTAIHPLVRRMFRAWHIFWPDDPFVSYESFLHEPWPGASRLAPSYMVTNFQKFLHVRLPQLRDRLDLANAADVRELVDWYVTDAAVELQLDLQLIEPAAARIGGNRIHATASGDASPSPADVTVVGYLRTASGVGEVSRQTLLTLAAGGLSVEGVDVALGVLSKRDDESVGERLVERGTASVQVFNVNADQIPAVLAHTRPLLQSGALRISVPFWELARFPDAWLPGLASMDEVWAPSRFIQTALAARLDCPVLHMPVAIEIEEPPPVPRARFGLPEDRFLFFFAFDFLSFVERKNPYAAIAAFRLAFPSRRTAGLVLKCMNSAAAAEKFAAFQQAIGGDSDIFLIEQTLSRADTLGLIAATDAVVSLHRSEGLGLLIAEAMLLGKSVIATDYSASREFLTEATGYPVGHRLVALREGEYPFWEDQMWADPDIAHAAWHMRRLAADPDSATARRTNARENLRQNHSRAVVGQLQAQRLRLLLSR